MIYFATIGTGWITTSFIDAAHASKKWTLVAVYSRSAETAKNFASKHKITTTHTSIDDLVRDRNVQAIYIASPNSLHFAHAKRCLEAGKHVILEKPATSTSKELDELLTLAKVKGVYLIEAFRHIYEPNFKTLQASLGKLGTVYGATLNYASRSSRFDNVLAGETPNIFSLDFSGGCLVDLGVYPISAAIALFGAPLSSTYKPVILSTGADGGGFVVLNYKSFGVSINISKIYTSTAPSEIFGQHGTLVLNAITDIESVGFLDAKTKRFEDLGGEKVEAKLNMLPEAEQFANMINGEDDLGAGWLESVSRAVIDVTEGLRKENQLVFKVERE